MSRVQGFVCRTQGLGFTISHRSARVHFPPSMEARGGVSLEYWGAV